ncbi:MAG: hemolysin family protein [Geodermatophilaceae bacterium]
MTEWLLVAATFVLTAGTALFVSAEFSLVSVDRRQVEQAVQAGDPRAVAVDKAVRSLSTQLSAAQVGITLTALVVGFIAEPSIATLLRGPLVAAGLSEGSAGAVAIAAALIVATVVQMVLGELVPQNLAIARPLQVARIVAPLQAGFATATRPVVRVLNGTANRLLRLFGIQPQEELRSVRTPEELQSLARRSAELGTLSAHTGQLVDRSLRLRGRLAEDVMTPRVRMHVVHADEPVSAVIGLALRTGNSRFPVVGQTTDDVLGVVHVKRAVAVPAAQRDSTPVSAVAGPLPSVPSSLGLEPLLDQLRTSGPQMVVVVDEYGGTDGLVTLEDLVEELVGEVPDEHDPPMLRQTRRSGNGWSVSGLLRPDEVTRATDLDIPEGDYETVAGLVLERLGRLPRRGDEVHVGSVRLVVERVVNRRIERLLVAPLPPAVDQQ